MTTTLRVALDEMHRVMVMFIVIDPRRDHEALADRVIAHLHAGDGAVRYPGERTIETRRRNLREGVPADAAIWQQVQDLAGG